MPRKAPWYQTLADNPAVVTISTVAALVTIASYQWAGTDNPGIDPMPPADDPPAPVFVGTGVIEPIASTSGVVNGNAVPVVMMQPRSGQTVDQFTDMRFDVAGEPPPGYTPVAYVRDPLGQYWSFGPTLPGAFKRVQVGTRDDRGREFEMGVWITNHDPPRDEPFEDPPGTIGQAAVRVLRR